MILSFRDPEAERILNYELSDKLPADIQVRVLIKLLILSRAVDLQDLRIPPNNRLKALSGDREGQHSIRINEAWRICFTWEDGNAYDVEIVRFD